MMSDDMTLVREFAANQSEPAFAALVKGHIALVHSAALRQVGDAHLAEEITQAVFIILARKAASLGPKTILSAWLYRTTRYAAADALRARRRRQAREQEVHMQSILNQPDADAWAQLAPLLDDALAELGETDRTALVLRFFENKTAREIAGALRMEEAAAQKRVARALEKLRALFVKRGVTLTATVIAGAVAANSVQAAPVGMAVTVTAAAAKGAAVGSSTLTIIKGALKLMAWTKAKMAIAMGVGILLAAGTTVVIVKESNVFRVKLTGIDAYISDCDMQAFLDAPPMLAIQSTHFPKYQGTTGRSTRGKMAGRDRTLRDLIVTAYDFHTPRIIFPPDMPTNHYDFLVTVADHPYEKFQAEIKNSLGFAARKEIRDVDVQVLQVASSGAGKLKAGNPSQSSRLDHRIAFDYPNQPVSVLAESLEYRFRMPVIDRTGLAGNYNMVFDWNWQGNWNGKDREANLNSLKKTLYDQLGLELISSREPVEMLVVEKVK